ncbi:hypothetical protein [Persicobacter diffluens]|uniref:Uncharacterized protein n=1 Tax=Persicobacter diffluens TaxID=981 RepID=A0AAN4W5B6_9BACT|nr:hypothetical protein PEDI_54450 [Persicobacter diffluens]
MTVHKNFFDAGASAFLMRPETIALLSENDRQIAQSGGYRLLESSFYAKKEITGWSGSNQIIDANIQFSEGLISIDRGKFGVDQNFIMQSIHFGVYVGAEADPFKARYSTLLQDSPVELLHSVLRIEQKNAGVKFEMPIGQIMQQQEKRGVSQGFQLSVYQMLAAQEEIVVKIITPGGYHIRGGQDDHVHVNFLVAGKLTQRKK